MSGTQIKAYNNAPESLDLALQSMQVHYHYRMPAIPSLEEREYAGEMYVEWASYLNFMLAEI